MQGRVTAHAVSLQRKFPNDLPFSILNSCMASMLRALTYTDRMFDSDPFARFTLQGT